MKRWRWLILVVPLLLIVIVFGLANIPLDDLQPFRKYELSDEEVQFYGTYPMPYGMPTMPVETVQFDVVDAPSDLVSRYRKEMRAKHWKEIRLYGTNEVRLETDPVIPGRQISILPDSNRDGSPNLKSLRVTEFRTLSPFDIWILRLRTWKWNPFDEYIAK